MRRYMWWLVLAPSLAWATDPVGDVVTHAEQSSDLGVHDTLVATHRVNWRGHQRVRLLQHHRGVPVWRSDVVVHLDRVGQVRRVRSDVFALDLSVVPSFSASQVQALLHTSREPKLWIHPYTRALVWHVDVGDDVVIDVQVDATTGQEIHRRARTLHAKGLVYGSDFDGPDEVTLLLPDGATELNDSVVRARSQVWIGDRSVSRATAIADEQGNFLYEPVKGVQDPFTEVNAYHHVTTSLLWLHDRFDFPMPNEVDIVANVQESPGEPYDNAYHQQLGAGSHRLALGEGSYDHGHDVDTIIHELGHGVVGDVGVLNEVPDYPVYHDEKGIHLAAGALIEGLPDYLAATYSDDPGMSGPPNGPPLRDLANDTDCLTWPIGEAHWDAYVIGGTLWSLREAIGADGADAIAYGLISGLQAAPSFPDVAREITFLAETLRDDGDLSDADVQAVADVIDARKLNQCEPYVRVQDDVRFSVVGTDVAVDGVCALLQGQDIAVAASYGLALEVPELDGGTLTGGTLTLAWEEQATGEPVTGTDLKYRVAMQIDDTPTFDLDRLDFGGLSLSYITDVQEPAVVVDGSPATVALPIQGLVPGQTIYAAIVHSNCPVSMLTASVDWQIEPAETRGACACSSTSSVGWAWAIAGLLVLGWRRRRA